LPPDLAAARKSSQESGVLVGLPIEDYQGQFGQLELRWERCQTALPSPDGYQGQLPSEPPALVSVEQVAAAFRAVATPRRPARAERSTSTAAPRQRGRAAPPATLTRREQRWQEAWVAQLFDTAAEMVQNPGAFGKPGHHDARLAAGKLLGGLIPLGLATAAEIENFLYDAKVPSADAAKELRAIRDGIAAGEREPLTPPELPAREEPRFNQHGQPICPHCGKRLQPSKNGNGWRCLDAQGNLCFWWAGEDDSAHPRGCRTRFNMQTGEQEITYPDGRVVRIHPDRQAQRLIQDLLDGTPPPEHLELSLYGAWSETVAQLVAAWEEGGSVLARQLFKVLGRTNADLPALMERSLEQNRTGLRPGELRTVSGPTPDQLRTESGLTPDQLRTTTEPPPYRVIHSEKLHHLPRHDWLIEDVLPLGVIAQLFGAPGEGKSHLLLDMALTVAQHYPVIYIAAEDVEQYENRINAWCTHHGLGRGHLYFLPTALNLMTPAVIQQFLQVNDDIHPALIIVDPLAQCGSGGDLDSTRDMTLAVEGMLTLRQATGATVLVAHHTGWNSDHERGSSVLRGACRTVYKLVNDDGLIRLTCEKMNNATKPEPRHFRLMEQPIITEDGEAATSVIPIPSSRMRMEDAPLTEKQYQVLEALELETLREATFSQILDYTEQRKSTLHHSISRLLKRGYLKEIEIKGRKTYHLSRSGQQALEDRTRANEESGLPTGPSGVNWRVRSRPVQPDPDPTPPPNSPSGGGNSTLSEGSGPVVRSESGGSPDSGPVVRSGAPPYRGHRTPDRTDPPDEPEGTDGPDRPAKTVGVEQGAARRKPTPEEASPDRPDRRAGPAKRAGVEQGTARPQPTPEGASPDRPDRRAGPAKRAGVEQGTARPQPTPEGASPDRPDRSEKPLVSAEEVKELENEIIELVLVGQFAQARQLARRLPDPEGVELFIADAEQVQQETSPDPEMVPPSAGPGSSDQTDVPSQKDAGSSAQTDPKEPAAAPPDHDQANGPVQAALDIPAPLPRHDDTPIRVELPDGWEWAIRGSQWQARAHDGRTTVAHDGYDGRKAAVREAWAQEE
jgi:hypothetical protein